MALGGVVPVAAGVAGVLLGPAMMADGAYPISADSHLRYLSGILAALGVAFWTTIPDIERHTARFRLLTALVVAGGISRLVSLITVGVPSGPMLFGLLMELGVTPALCWWQGTVAARCATAAMRGY